MFATCIFCHSSLGSNEALELFPVGKRLAFDAEKGRLWVVCPKCERWNLSPLEERWEAIEEAEHSYRDTTKRIATDNIGLARLGDGTELIRIGAPLRPEFAAWRYGDQFGRRRRRQLLIGGGIVTAAAGVFVAGPMMGLMIGGGGGALFNVLNLANGLYQNLVPSARITDGTGRVLSISANNLRSAKLSLRGDNDHVQLQIRFREWSPTGPLLTSLGVTRWPNAADKNPAHLVGDVALRATAAILPSINGGGGSKSDVQSAVHAIEKNRNSVHSLLCDAFETEKRIGSVFPQTGSVRNIHRPLRLALEMLLHEDDERRALEGELQTLAQRWKDAEEIAAIADSLMLPAHVADRVNAMRSPREP